MNAEPQSPSSGRRGPIIALAALCLGYVALVLLFNLGNHDLVWANCEEDLHFRNAYWLSHGHPLLDPNRPPLYYYLSIAASLGCGSTFRGGQLISAISAGLLLLLSTLLVRRLLGTRAAAVALALCAVNSTIFEYAGSNCTDMLFAALAAGALLAASGRPDEVPATGRSFGAGCLLGLATAARFQGYVLLACLLLWLLLRREINLRERLRHAGALIEGFALLFVPLVLPMVRLGGVQPLDALGLATVSINLGEPQRWAEFGALGFVLNILRSYGQSFLKLVQAGDLLALVGLAWLFSARSRRVPADDQRRLLLVVCLGMFVGLGLFRGSAWDLRRSFLLLLPLLLGLFGQAADRALSRLGRAVPGAGQPMVAGLLLAALTLGLLVFNARQFLTWRESQARPALAAFIEFDEQWRRPHAGDGLLLTNVHHYLIEAGNGFHSQQCCFDEQQFRYWIALLVEPNPVRAIFIELGDKPLPSLEWQRADDYFHLRRVPTTPGFVGFLVNYSQYPDDALTRLSERGIDAPKLTPVE
ncbi:MAG: glycosyltransferase family 39 protein [Candidatus Alcyoniella australis]|nr:glycosyltransferase family 39 protein [Candidatus Alcyoniella australis]